MSKAIIIIIMGISVAGIIWMARVGPSLNVEVPVNNVSVVNGVQIIEITARGGYWPKNSIAQAGIPTILRIETNGTFDCSRSFRIPSMNYQTILPQSGNADVDLGSPVTGTLNAMCGMGMYRLAVEFK